LIYVSDSDDPDGPPSLDQSIVTVLVELALTVASYVLLKPLIGYWCLIPVAIFGYLTAIGAFAALVIYVANSSPDVAPPESGEPEDE